MKERITIYNLVGGKKDTENGGCFLDSMKSRLGYGTFPYKRSFLSDLDLTFVANVETVSGKRYLKLSGIQPINEDKCKFVVELQERGISKNKIRFFLKHYSINDLKTKEVEYFYQECKFSKAMAIKFQDVYNDIFESCTLNQLLKDTFGDSITYKERDDIVNVSKTANKDILDNPFIYWPSEKSKIRDSRKRDIAELMRKKLKVPDNDRRRMVAYMKYVLRKDLNNGHCYMLLKEFMASLFHTDNLGPDLCTDIEQYLQAEDFYTNGGEIYLKYYYEYERNIGQKIQKMLSKNNMPSMEVHAPDLDKTQNKAIRTALNNNLSFICGGPGTGKTQIIKTILKHLQGEHVHLMASTHKAAQHLRKICKHDATTFHSVTCKSEIGCFEEYHATFKYHATFIIDEISMMDVSWASRFFNQFANQAKRIILIGDHFQLPSVGPGAIARDLYNHPRIPQVELTTCYRTNSKTIYENSSLLRNEKLTTPFKEDDSFQTIKYGKFLEPSLSREIAGVDKAYSPSSPSGVKILCQTNEDAKIANKKAQAQFNKDGQICPFPYWQAVAKETKCYFRIGDRVQVREKHGDFLLSGDEGTILDWVDDGAEIKFDNGYQGVLEKPQQIALSYASTIHKSQGAEFSNIFVVLSHRMICQCLESIYTGITRSKDRCLLFYPNQDILKKARTNRLNRRTKLRQYLNKRSI